MSNPAHLFRLQSIFREVFDDPTLVVEPGLSAATLPSWDSVATVQLVLAIEQEFGIRLATDEVAGLKSAGDLLGLIARKSP